jgi:hypothetical protein
MAKIVSLTNGFQTLVDDEDYDWISKYKWYAWKHGYTYYVKRVEWVKGGKVRSILLHREIMKPHNNMQIDHLDRDGLNNQKDNLRICTQAENNRNKRKHYNLSKFN